VGIVRRTQRFGKSLTMLRLLRNLRPEESQQQPTVLAVTD